MDHEIIIIGAGPAGLTAAIYLGRSRMDVLLVEADCIGGQASRASFIENYPGFPEGMYGADLTEKFREQAERFGVKVAMNKVETILMENGTKMVITDDGQSLTAKSLIIASGAHPRKLGVLHEEELAGCGVCYCATCDGPLFSGEPVAVVGGGNVAIEDAIFLSGLASRVHVIHRREELRATKVLQDELFSKDNVEVIWDSVVTEITPVDGKVNSVLIKNLKNEEARSLNVKGIFIAIGQDPNNAFLKGVLRLDEQGYIITDENLETSETGIFAAGDIRKNRLKQVAVAVGEGALAAFSAGAYVRKERT